MNVSHHLDDFRQHMTDLCTTPECRISFGHLCAGGPCQMDDTEVCNMTIQFLLSDSFLRRGCFGHWEEEPCALLHLLVSKCQLHRGRVQMFFLWSSL